MTNQANIDINIDDSAVDQLTRSLDALSGALNKTAGEFNQAEREADDLEKDLKDLKGQADRTERSMAALGGAAAALGVGVVALAGAFELTKISIEAFAETNEEASARIGMLKTAGQELLGSLGQVALGGDNFAQTLEALTQIAEELTVFVNDNSEALANLAVGGIRLAVRGFFALADGVLAVIQFYENLDENMGLLQAAFLDLKADVLEFAQDAEQGIADFVAGAIDNLADLIDASDNVFEAIVDNPAFAALFGFEEGEFEGPATFVANSLRDMANTIRGGEFDRFQDTIDDAALSAEELRRGAAATVSETAQLRQNLQDTEEATLNSLNNITQMTARPIEVEVTGGDGGAGGAGLGRTEAEAQIEQAKNLAQIRLAANILRIELIGVNREFAKLGEDTITEALGGNLSVIIEELQAFNDAEMIKQIYEAAKERYGEEGVLEGLRGELQSLYSGIRTELEQTRDQVIADNIRMAAAMEKLENSVSAEELAIHRHFEEMRRGIDQELQEILSDTEDWTQDMQDALEMPGFDISASGMFFSEREVELMDRQIELADEYSQALEDFDNRQLGFPMDLSSLNLDRVLPSSEFRDSMAIDPVIDDMDELKDRFDELPRRIRNAAAEANMSFSQIVKTVVDANEAMKEAFKDSATAGLENSFNQLGQLIGDSLAFGLDEGESAAERAKKIAGKIAGVFLQTIGATAIAQGMIAFAGDPETGGFSNPAKGAALIAAGTAAIALGGALSGMGSKGGVKKPTGGPATTTGGGGGGAAETSTQIFIENRFGNRFDAREIDRAAADSFARAAAAGQA
jgi:hypothetical protein